MSIALAAGTLLLAGCGEDAVSKEEYAETTGEVLRPLAAELRAVPDLTSGVSSPRQLSRRLESVRETLPGSIEALERTSPPGDVEGIHAALIGVLEDFNRRVTALQEASEGGDAIALSRATTGLIEGWERLQEGLADFRRNAMAAGVPTRRSEDQDDESE